MHQPQQQPQAQQPGNDAHRRAPRRRPRQVSWTKILLVAILGGLALFLQVTVWTLEDMIDQHQQSQELQSLKKSGGKSGGTVTSEKSSPQRSPFYSMVLRALEENMDGVKKVETNNNKGISEKKKDTAGDDSDENEQEEDTKQRAATTTIKSSKPMDRMSLHLQKLQHLHLSSSQDNNDASHTTTSTIQHQHGFGTSRKAQAQAFFKVAVDLWLKAWDANVVLPPHLQESTWSSSSSSSSSDSSSKTTPFTNSFQMDMDGGMESDTTEEEAQWPSNMTVFALQRAADGGHATAQFHVANAYAAGFWPSLTQPSDSTLQVQESWTLPKSKQQQQAWMYWHMAAVQGHVEAAMVMAHRIESAIPSIATATSKSSTPAVNTCERVLPYFQAAAAGIIDQLETDVQSRAKVHPASDKHVLHQIHLHGGTASKLDYFNKADESPEALQFYHLRATSVTTTAQEREHARRQGHSLKSSGNTSPEQAAAAAYTLGNYYQHGVRGVTQNLTLAARYYEMAALQNHWEAAGQVGRQYLWGIGVEQDAYRAYKFFKMGVPTGFANCQHRYNKKANKNKNNRKKKDDDADETDNNSGSENLSLCESNCMNGMGLLRLLGLPHLAPLDVDGAIDYFSLAKDQGNIDAAYNLAMVKLGWKLHWKEATGVDEHGNAIYDFTDPDGETDSDDDKQKKKNDQMFPLDTTKKLNARNYPTRSEYQSIVTDLATAASKGHIQARFRLGMMYATGVKIPDSSSSTSSSKNGAGKKKDDEMVTVVKRDCENALRYFRWLSDNVSPERTWRLRKAYKQFVAGQKASSLRNYLVAAETGSDFALLNAGFLLEQGTCLGLSSTDCARASVRLWKHAAEKGHPEASLRVGDTYYYGRFRKDASVAQVGPFGWVHWVLYPEEFVVHLYNTLTKPSEPEEDTTATPTAETTTTTTDLQCSAGDDAGAEEGTCVPYTGDATNRQKVVEEQEQQQHTSKSDLEMAAHFYRLAADTAESPRANFNLGFLYEWGLGLKQDFPLAKRHYDLAVSGQSKEAELPVAIALINLNMHEQIVKLYMGLQQWWNSGDGQNDDENGSGNAPSAQESSTASVPRIQSKGRTKTDVILSHLASWESLAILLLTILLSILLRHRQTRRRP